MYGVSCERYLAGSLADLLALLLCQKHRKRYSRYDTVLSGTCVHTNVCMYVCSCSYTNIISARMIDIYVYVCMYACAQREYRMGFRTWGRSISGGARRPDWDRMLNQLQELAIGNRR